MKLNYQVTIIEKGYKILRRSSGVAKGEQKERPPPQPGKFAKDEKQPTPQPAMSINSRRQFWLNFPNFYLNFLKNFRNFQ